MTNNLVLTVIGDDKPGLVESLADVIAENSGNWLESSMSQLAGKFAGILRVSVADESADKLIAELNKLPDNLKLVIEKVNVDEFIAEPRTMNLNLVGNDRPGIIRDISRVLAGRAVNVEELNTSCSAAPMSGETLFKGKAVVKIPVELDIDELQLELERLADDLIVEIELE
ncbi:MAG: ACT domain-containing protein [Gammaproteobacteria bacterium]|jgi:glycine cleavage system regulatory protein|nr:glycine cleavage system protein R [Gammaproteobacteria bacterium]MDP6096216.1 ACT domain-containing protein [Gammaproteobacteria bacterium]|tara:strand:- start:331 stop:843 length:513 start_codon:yes stop_codon:yes gene_type:complete